MFREDRLAVEIHLENAVAPFDQLRLDAGALLDTVRQTGGTGQVVSDYAVFDGNSNHVVSPGRIIARQGWQQVPIAPLDDALQFQALHLGPILLCWREDRYDQRS